MSHQFHPAAAREHLDSIAFYESRLHGLGASYIAEFEATMTKVCAAPKSFRIECSPDIRLAVMKRFPFNVLFRETGKVVQVLAVAHHRRRPEYWLGRSVDGL